MNQGIKKHLDRLNACPTCGKKDEIQTGQRSPGRFFIECYRCHVSVADDRWEKVQAHWNEIGHHFRERVKELEGALSDSLDKVSKGLYFLAGATLEKELKK